MGRLAANKRAILVTGANEAGVKVEHGGSVPYWTRKSPSVPELTGLGEETDRDAAIVALSIAHDWSASRLSNLFGISERHVRRVVLDFKRTFGVEG